MRGLEHSLLNLLPFVIVSSIIVGLNSLKIIVIHGCWCLKNRERKLLDLILGLRNALERQITPRRHLKSCN